MATQYNVDDLTEDPYNQQVRQNLIGIMQNNSGTPTGSTGGINQNTAYAPSSPSPSPSAPPAPSSSPTPYPSLLQRAQGDQPVGTSVVDQSPKPAGPAQPPAPQQQPSTPKAPFSQQTFQQAVQNLPPTPEALASLIGQHPEWGVQITGSKGDKIILPSGQVVDVILGAGAGGQGWQWLMPGAGGQGQGQGAGAPSVQYGDLFSKLAQTPGLSEFQQQLRQILMQRMGQAQQPVSPDDPNIKAQMGAAERVADKQRIRRRAAEAERLTQQGLGDSGALDTAVASGYEDMSQMLSGLQAQIVGREMQAKRDELQNLLGMAMQASDAESARTLQAQIAALDAELRRLGLSQQGEQFNAQLGQQQSQWNDQNDLNWANFSAGLV